MTHAPRKGFALLAVLVFASAAMVVVAVGVERYLSVSARVEEASARLQASNLAAEGLELLRGWTSTRLNADREGGWARWVAPLGGTYVASYGQDGYSLAPGASETIPFGEPRAVEFVRVLEIRAGKLPGEKDAVCTVSWGGPFQVQYQVTLTDA